MKAVGKYAVKKVLTNHQEKAMAARTNNIEVIEVVDPATGQTKRRWWQKKKQPELGLSPQETAVLKKVKKRAKFLDSGFKICCCNIGLDPLLGLIPVVGDFIALMFAIHLVNDCMKVNLPSNIKFQMFFNVALDFGLGLIPILGDIADYFYKCNIRNAVLLEEFLVTRRRDQILVDRGALPQDHVPGTGTVPGTGEPPSAHAGPSRITVEDDGVPSSVTEVEEVVVGTGHGGASTGARMPVTEMEETKGKGEKGVL
ncbi:hypothetical protein BC936DRAFT_146301 [Jimgerdemannia flammicorona]|uniref:DUF4112 domain-containing protein n=1 Tax=Jimgerdemannia flammicorona TaxID=994334 RepID=A0A433DLI3_9FUNG|nr:hypothetical protein BC936DRAFT_146301 [Jimgerdemannia flammicorona]